MLLVSAAIGLSAQPLAAQTTDEQNDEAVDPITIVVTATYVPTRSETATKSDIPLVETPQSISVVTREQIDLLNFIDAQQAVRYVSGVSGENFGPDLRFDFIAVRGFVPRQFIDGLATPVSTTIASTGVDLYAFDSLDILKGPASVLYGSAPPGGIYNQTSRRAGDEIGAEIMIKYGTNDFKQIAASGNVPFSDSVAGRLTFLIRDRGADRDFVDASRVLVAPTFNFKLGPDTEIDLLGYYQEDKVDGDTNGFLPAVGTLLNNPLSQIPRSTNLGEPDFNVYNRDQYAVGFDFGHSFSNALQFQVNMKWSEYSEDRDVIFGTGLDVDNRTVFRGNSPYREDVEALTVDARLAGDFATGTTGHKILVGIDYRDVHNVSGFGFTGAPSIDLFDPNYNAEPLISPGVTTRFNDQVIKQTGLYLQDQISIGAFRVLLSGRYDWVESDQAPAFTVFDDGPGPRTNRDQEKFTYRAGLNYILDNGIAPYISYAISFEPQLGTSGDGDPFDPTTGDQIEAGVKFDGRNLAGDVDIFATFAVFQITQQNVVSIGGNPNLIVFGSQVGEVEVQGAEFEIVTQIDEQLSINASVSYTDSEVTESSDLDQIGDPLPVTPEWKAAALLDYSFGEGALSGFGFNVGVRYNDESAGSLQGPFNPVVLDSDSSFLVDGSLRYDLNDSWRFAINASNLFDKRYVARCGSFSNCNFGAGREVIGTVVRKF